MKILHVNVYHHHHHQVRHRHCGDFSNPPHTTSTWCICGHRRLPFLLGLVTRQPPLTTGRLSPGGGQDDHDEKDCGDDHDDDDQRCYIPHQSSEA